MGKIFIRVDDRLIHGQTILAWCPNLGIEEIIAVDNVSASNPILKSIMEMGVPSSYKTNIFTTQEAELYLKEDLQNNILVIVKSPLDLKDIESIINKCEYIILGNLAKKSDSNYKLDNATGIFYLSDKDIKYLDYLSSKNINIFYQQLPNTNKILWQSSKNLNKIKEG